jgi:hypothetical protein
MALHFFKIGQDEQLSDHNFVGDGVSDSYIERYLMRDHPDTHRAIV